MACIPAWLCRMYFVLTNQYMCTVRIYCQSTSMYSPLVLGVSTTGTSGTTTAATDIQSHMEKYLTADVDSVNELDGDSDGNSINGDDDDSAQFNSSRSRSRGFSSGGGSRPTMTTTSAHHHHVTSGVDCKAESDGQLRSSESLCKLCCY